MASEIERKYEVPVGFAVADGAPRTAQPSASRAVHQLIAVYYDTPDLRLAQDRVALRRRTGGTDAGWHVKRYRRRRRARRGAAAAGPRRRGARPRSRPRSARSAGAAGCGRW